MNFCALASDFADLDRRRRDLDASDDDVQRANVDQEWIAVAQQIIALPATTKRECQTQARVLLTLMAAGADDIADAAARALAEDLRRWR